MLAMDSSTVIGTGMPLASRGPNKLLIRWPLSYGESVQYGRTAPCISGAYIPASLKAFAVVFRAAVTIVLKQRNGVVDLFLDGERTIADATAAQHKTGLLQEIFFLPHRQFVLLRQFDRRRRANFFAASTEDAAPEIKLPRKLSCGEVGFNR